MHSDTTPSSLSFEAKLKQLETILSGLETGELPLEEWMQAYAQGIQLLKSAQEQIQAVELQIQQLEAHSNTFLPLNS